MSLGNVARSTSSTRWPARASSIAVGAPAHRAPTMIASYMIRFRQLGIPLVRNNAQITLPMGTAEFVQLLFDCGRIRLGLTQHGLLSGGRIHSVGLDGKVVVVAHDKSHRAKRSLRIRTP